MRPTKRYTWNEQGARVRANAYLVSPALTVWLDGIALWKARKTWLIPLPILILKGMLGILQWHVSHVLPKHWEPTSSYMHLTMARQDERCSFWRMGRIPDEDVVGCILEKSTKGP